LTDVCHIFTKVVSLVTLFDTYFCDKEAGKRYVGADLIATLTHGQMTTITAAEIRF